MGWQTDDGSHEGWPAAEFTGDRFSIGTSSGQATIRHFGPGPGPLPRPAGEPQVIDGRQALGWRGLCECGWRGPLWQRVADAAEHDPAARRVWVPDLDQYGDAPEEVDEGIYAEWHQHVAPDSALQTVRQEAAEVAAHQARLAAAVRTARRAGASWAAIGSAAGITRQSAHERWAKETGDYLRN